MNIYEVCAKEIMYALSNRKGIDLFSFDSCEELNPDCETTECINCNYDGGEIGIEIRKQIAEIIESYNIEVTIKIS